MGKLCEWVKWNGWEIYEGQNLVLVGCGKSDYSLHEKGTVIIREDTIDYRHKGYYGTYQKRKDALSLFGLVEKAMNNGGELVLKLCDGDSDVFKKGGGWMSYVPKTKALIIVYHQDYPSDLKHELEHKRLGYYKKNITPKQEVEVVGSTIQTLKREGLYSPKERARTIDLLSGYIKGERKETRNKAENVVVALEKGMSYPTRGIRWKTKWGKLC